MSLLARVHGILAEKSADSVIVFAGGLGLSVQVPLSTMRLLPDTGSEIGLRTQLYVRESTLALYGFATEQEDRMFELLISVSGVGPKAALNCLSAFSCDELAASIGGADAAALRRVPGIGQRTADRIILELKGRVPEFAGAIKPTPTDDETVAALMFYGYSAQEAAAAVAALPADPKLTVEERTLLALQYFAPRAGERSAARS